MADVPDQPGLADSHDPGESDSTVALRFSRGEAGAFARLVKAHQEGLARLVHRLLGWSGEVEDVVQDVFLAAWTKRRQLRRPESLATWLASIAVNRCRNYRRGRFLRTVLLGERDEEVAAGESPWRPAGPRDGAPQRAIDREATGRLRRAVRALPPRLREVVVLRYLQEMDLEEVARVLGIRPGAARVRLHRARAALKAALPDLAEEGE
jgi:RNA polymerase sigma-70 factor (ECF subfamily)